MYYLVSHHTIPQHKVVEDTLVRHKAMRRCFCGKDSDMGSVQVPANVNQKHIHIKTNNICYFYNDKKRYICDDHESCKKVNKTYIVVARK